jgi:hypothetical protein
MDKKEIYEHLANIYLDASSKTNKKNKSKEYSPFLRNIFLFTVAVIFTLTFSQLFHSEKPYPVDSSQIALVLQNEATKINFNFDPAKKETLILNLNNLDLAKFNKLGFSIRKTNSQDTVNLRVEFINRFREKSAVYFRDIPSRWKDYLVNFSEFKDITNWKEMISLAFIIEEWNVRQKKGIVYVDNIRLLR